MERSTIFYGKVLKVHYKCAIFHGSVTNYQRLIRLSEYQSRLQWPARNLPNKCEVFDLELTKTTAKLPSGSLVNIQKAIENGTFIVDLPIKNGGSFHSYVAVYQRVLNWRRFKVRDFRNKSTQTCFRTWLNPNLVGGWPTPLKIWVHQLGLWHSQYMKI